MIMRSLQPRFARHLMGFPHTDFGSLVQALYGIEEGIARGLWSESSPTDSKGKRPSGGQRSGDVGAISSAGMRPSRRYQTVGQTPGYYYPPSPHAHYRPPTPSRPMTPTYLHPDSQPVFAAHVQRGLLPHILDPELHRPLLMCRGHHVSLLSWGPGHDTDHCTALRHAIQDLIDQGLVNLGQPSVTLTLFLLILHTHYEIDGVSLVPQTPAPFSLIPDEAPFQLTHPTPLVIGCQDTFVPFTLWPEDDDSAGREIQIVTRSGRIAQPPPPAVRPFEGTPLMRSTHRDALIRALSQIRVETTTTPEGLIHMMTAGRATCIVFSDDDLPPDGLDHVRPLYITVGCSGRRVPSVLLDNGSALNVCPLATAIALGFAPSDFGPSLLRQSGRMIAPRGRLWVLRIPTSFNLLLGRPWIHVAGAIPSSLHQKVKFIHDGQVITVRSTRDIFALLSQYFRSVTHSSTVVLDMMRGMTFLPGMGLGRRQQGPSEFIAAIDHDTTFGLGFIPTEAITVTWRGCARRGGSETRPRLEEIDSVVHTDTERDRASASISPATYRDEMDMMTVSQITSIVQLQPVSAFDMFGVSTIEVFEGTQTLPVPELPEDDSSLFEGIVSPVEGASDLVDPPLSFDVLSGFVSRSDDVSVASFMDLSIFEDSFDHDSGPIDERVSPAAGDVETVDFGTEDQPRELKIGSPLSTDERDRLIHLLRSYLDVFAWSYEDMPGLDPSIVQHHLPTLPHARPVKQKLRRLHPRWSLQVKEEIQKQLSVGFISVVEYPEWLANVVPVPKKDGKVRVCVDFRDLNKASPKDDFPLPHIDLLVDGTAGHSMLSFMDGFSGYNQILMAPEDMEKTAFITEWGTYCYRVMPFGLKNAGATYQRAATTLFHDMMHRDVEVYVDDMIVKSRGRADHLDALERFFERIRKFRLRLNPKKCTFGVTSGKLLGHMVSERA
ncbi:Transposon Ty3-G Gag-Pol polyprotein [Vitis vinifera]|uniref:Transposon Ty3-G Gag-Pol polyprotein n=1 Tax=Vitis vinifera TaxID=29760 RepID=A0A438CMN5_VITVI|nr:Transposon Ty3-G Gag-Pol polyprotein [Vitis vinifera]